MARDRGRQDKVVVIHVKVYMHCKACERAVCRTLCKLKGVGRVSTDMENNHAVVIGRVEPNKLLKKLRKKTGKRAEILSMEEDTGKGKCYGDEQTGDCWDKGWMVQKFETLEGMNDGFVLDLVEMFSDENPTACTIM